MSQSAAKPLKTNIKYGVIYMCVSPSGKKYIGQHNTPDIFTRKRSHNYRYFEFLKKKCILELKRKFDPSNNKEVNPKGFCTNLYCAFEKYGYMNFVWKKVMINVPLQRLNHCENKMIEKHNTLSPNGYNLKINGSMEHKTYSTETLQRMSESHKKAIKNNLHKYRKKHDELKDVPQHVTYFESGGVRGYRILRHPNCPFKQFVDATTPVETLKKQMLDFLKECEEAPYQTVQQKKAITNVPKGISADNKRGGKNFLVQFGYKGKRYNKYFSGGTREENLATATEWMQQKKETLKLVNE